MRRIVAPAPEAPIAPGPVPSFSIVIPAYQSAELIGDALDSALSQTFAPEQVIVCDDGSTDDLASAVAPFRERIVFLRRPHRGAAAARNAAVDVASGDFVVMLDADDVYEPERLRALADLGTARPDLDILGTDLYYEDEGSLNGRFYEFTQFPVERQRLRILETCFVACPALRRSRVLEVGGFDETPAIAPAEDWDLFIRLIIGGSKVGIVDEPLMRYRKQPASATANRSRSLKARVTVLEKRRLDARLTPTERRFLDACVARARSRAVINDAKGLVGSTASPHRRSLLGLVSTQGITPLTRLALAAAAFAPVGRISLLTREERRVARSRVGSPSRRRLSEWRGHSPLR